MQLSIDNVVKAIALVAPAGDIVEAIYEGAKGLFNDDADQETLKAAYERAKVARAAADADFDDAVHQAQD